MSDSIMAMTDEQREFLQQLPSLDVMRTYFTGRVLKKRKPFEEIENGKCDGCQHLEAGFCTYKGCIR